MYKQKINSACKLLFRLSTNSYALLNLREKMKLVLTESLMKRTGQEVENKHI